MSTNDYKSRSDSLKSLFIVTILAILIFVIFLLTGCSSPESKTDPKASQATSPAKIETQKAGTHAFGETFTYPDKISISVSEPTIYTPSETAAGVVEGQSVLAFEFVITNNSDQPFDPVTVLATAASGGVEAAGVFDTENGVGFPPQTSVLPGQTVKWNQAWSVADVEHVTVEVTVGFTRDSVIFTNVP